MIKWIWDREGWIDTEDENFFVAMTPSRPDLLELTFDSQSDFYDWLYGEG